MAVARVWMAVGGVAVAAVAAAGCASSSAGTSPGKPTGPAPVAQARTTVATLPARDVRDRKSYAYDRAHGARFLLDERTGSYAVVSARPARPRRLIVTLHGHNDTALRQYARWVPYAVHRRLGLAAVEWQTKWGRGATFLETPAIYSLARAAVRVERTPPGRVLLHGFSFGSYMAFETTSYDRSHDRLFALTLAESGGVHGATRDRALARTHWVLYCAGRDPWPQLTGCPAMRRARSFLAASDARIDAFMVDPPAGHGGLLRNTGDTERALDDFARLTP